MAEIFQLYYEVPVFYTTFVCTVFINLGHFYGENCYTTVLLLCIIFKLVQYIYFYIIKGIEICRHIKMAGQNSHAILDLGEDELQFSTHDYKSTTVSHMDYCGHMQYILYIGSTAIWSSSSPHITTKHLQRIKWFTVYMQ